MESRQQKILLILGMHRSGTSLLSGWLQECGLVLGDRLMGEGEGNVKGHFEDLDFHDFHEGVFKYCKIPYGGFEGFNKLSWNEYEKEKLNSLFEFKSRLHNQWAFKDPRTLLFLPMYQELPFDWQALGIFRPYKEVVDSLLRREWRHRQELLRYRSGIKKIRRKIQSKKYHERFIKKYADYYLTAWLTYNEKLLEFAQLNNDKIFVLPHYSLLQSEHIVVEQLKKWGFEINHSPMANFFDSSLMTTKTVIDLPLSSNLIKKADKLQQQLLSLSAI